MSVFVVLSKIDNEKLEKVIQSEFPIDHYKIAATQWLISAEGTAMQLTEKLGILDQEKGPGPAVVFAISGYYGRASMDMWEWIKNKLEKANG